MEEGWHLLPSCAGVCVWTVRVGVWTVRGYVCGRGVCVDCAWKASSQITPRPAPVSHSVIID